MVIAKLRTNSQVENLLKYYDVHHENLWGGIQNKIDEVVIFGPYGQVGLAVTRLALSLGIKVIAVTYKTKVKFKHPLFTQISYKDIDVLCKNDKLNVVFTGPINQIKEYELILQNTGRLICFSSTSKFTKESSKSRFYKKVVGSLSAGEDYVRLAADKYGFKFNILRPTLIFGFFLDRNITSIVKFIRKFRVFPVYKDGAGLRQPVHVEDLANSVITLLNSGKKTYDKEYNLSGGEKLSYFDMVNKLFEIQDSYPVIIKTKFLPLFMDIGGKLLRSGVVNKEVALNMEKDFVFSHTAAKHDFGYSPREFLENGIMDLNPIN